MGRAVSVAACALNQWALDFEGNLERIFRSEWGGGGGTGFAPRAPGSSSAGARWLPPPPPPGRREASPPSARFWSGRQRRPGLFYAVRFPGSGGRGASGQGRVGRAGPERPAGF